MKFCNIALYADDTVLYLARNNFGKAVRDMQADLHALAGWCSDNGIQMNTEKTSLMLFGSAKRIRELPFFEITVNKAPLNVMSSYRYLGVTTDSQLNYNLHVQKVITKVSLKLKQFRRMCYLLIFLVGATAESYD